MVMEFTEGQEVFTRDGEKVGIVNRIVVDPLTNTISHIIVEKGFLFSEDRVIPICAFAGGDAETLQLRSSVTDLDGFPYYREDYFVMARGYQEKPYLDWSMKPVFYYPPVGQAQNYDGLTPQGVVTNSPNIPADSVAITEGTQVFSMDEAFLGDVEQVITNDEGQITHIVISKSLIFSTEHTVPVGWVRRVSDDKIRLHVHEKTVQALSEKES